MMRRNRIIVLAAFLTGIALAGLHATGEAEASLPEIEFWTYADNRAQWLEDISVAFEEETGADVTISVLPFPQMHDQLQSALFAGTGAPDIADVNIYQFGRFTTGERTGFVALNDYLTASTMSDLYTSAALAPWTWEGDYYGLGNELNPTFMYYRWDLLEEAGIETPIETWEGFIEAGQQYVERTGKLFAWVEPNAWQPWFFLSMDGGGFFDENGEVAFDHELGRRVLQMMHDWIYVYEIAGIAPLDPPAQYGALGAGDYAVTFGASWYQGFLKDNVSELSGKWMMQHQPVFEDGMGSEAGAVGGTAMLITEQAADPDLAWRFISYANLDTDNLAEAFRRFNLFPTYKPMWDDPVLYQPDSYFNGQKPGEWISEAGSAIPAYNPSPYWFPIAPHFANNVLNPVVLGDMDVEQAMREGMESARALLEDY